MVFSVFRMKSSYLSRLKGNSAFTLLELMVAIAIIGILAAITVPTYAEYINRVRYMVALTDIRGISREADSFFSENGRYPIDLAEIGMANVSDPWGNPYKYLNVAAAGVKIKGPDKDKDNGPDKDRIRKDRSLHPVNSDYDLYSMGADGKSQAAFTANSSQDDIVRANDGGYLGYVKDY